MEETRLARSFIRLILLLAFASVLFLVVDAVAGAKGSAPSRGTTVQVVVKEMAISLSPSTVGAGPVTFAVRNAGTVEHELVVLRGGNKPAVKAFRASEKGWIGEVEGVQPGGAAKSVTLELKQGKYTLLCNLPGHFMLGMHAPLTVH